jgi:hypothetical protein
MRLDECAGLAASRGVRGGLAAQVYARLDDGLGASRRYFGYENNDVATWQKR